LAWALWESGLDGWALLPRLILFVPASTGERCPAFGNNGEVNLNEGMGAKEKGQADYLVAYALPRS
jgi:glucose dehydrogenase